MDPHAMTWNRVRSRVSLVALYLVLLLVVLFVSFPYFYMLSMSLMTDLESVALPPRLLPRVPQWENYRIAFQRIQGLKTYGNTLIVAGGLMVIQLFTSSLAGYGFAKFRFRGRDTLFFILLGGMTIPLFINIIPWFWMIQKADLDNTLWGVMFPHLVTPFGIFMLRQFMLDIPDELMDAARIDGASEFQIYYKIALPQCPPALATLGAFVFLYHWNDLLWPLIVLKDRGRWTINLMVTALQGYGGTGRHLEIAAGAMAVIPIIIMVILMQRYVVQSTTMAGIKG